MIIFVIAENNIDNAFLIFKIVCVCVKPWIEAPFCNHGK